MQDDAHAACTEFLYDVVSFTDDIVEGAWSPTCCAEWFRTVILDSLVIGRHEAELCHFSDYSARADLPSKALNLMLFGGFCANVDMSVAYRGVIGPRLDSIHSRTSGGERI